MPAGTLALAAPLHSEEAGERLPQDHLGPGGAQRDAGRLKAVPRVVPPVLDDSAARMIGEADIKAEAFERGADQVWVQWQQGTSVTSTTGGVQFASVTMTGGGSAWAGWNQSYASGTIGFTTTTATACISNGATWVSWNTPVQESEDQQREREERARLAAERWAAEDAERKAVQGAANARALELLRSMVSEQQWADYQAKGWFEVRGSRGRRWRIRKSGQSGNVDLMPETGEVREASFCAHPRDWLPNADAHLAQMLALVTDEEEFVRVANVHHGRRPVYEPLEPVREQERLAA